MSALVFAFSEDLAPAARLALALDLPIGRIALRRLPDDESLPCVGRSCPATVFVYAALDRPDAKLMPLFLTCDAFRRADVSRLVLIAPYMPYLRQDAVFVPGQPLSRDVIGALLGPRFDRIITVQPHLHRTAGLGPIFPGASVTALSAAEPLANAIGAEGKPVIVGPDEESEPWAAEVARLLGATHFSLCKHRRGDRDIDLAVPQGMAVGGRRVVLIDDICSTGVTLAEAAIQLRAAGARTVEVAVVHALSSQGADEMLSRAGVASMISTDSCAHATNRIHLAPLLAEALVEELA